MKDYSENIKRVKHYSLMLTIGEKIVANAKEDMEAFLAFLPHYQEIANYYGSEKYSEDLRLDEQGVFKDLENTGILGEDYTWDFLISYETILKSIKNK